MFVKVTTNIINSSVNPKTISALSSLILLCHNPSRNIPSNAPYVKDAIPKASSITELDENEKNKAEPTSKTAQRVEKTLERKISRLPFI